MPSCLSSPPAPAAAAPEDWLLDEETLPPAAALEPFEDSALGGQLALFTEPLTCVSPALPWMLASGGQIALDAEPPVAAEPLALPEGEDALPEDIVPPAAAPPEDGCEDELELAAGAGLLEELDDEALPPAAALSEPPLIEGELELALVLGALLEPEAEPPTELPVLDDCVVDAPWFIVEDELVSVDDWFAVTPLFTLWLPLPTLTPGLTLAPRLTSVLLMPTFASTPTFGLTFTPLLVEVDGELLEPPAADPVDPVCDWVCEDWVLCAPCDMLDDEFTSVEVWLADTPLFTVLLPLPTLTPGLMLAPALTSVLLMPTLASTPTFGLTFTPVLVDVEPDVEPPVDDCWLVDVPWLMVDVEFVSVDDWLALTLLDVLFEPLAPSLPTFTPGLMLAPAFTSLLPMPTFAPTPTFGLTLTLLSVLVCAKAVPNTPITAAAVRLTANFLTFMCSPLVGNTKDMPASPVPSRRLLMHRG